MSLLAELRRRNVIRMAGLYLVGAWLLTQVTTTVLPLFDIPTWVPRAVVVLLALGFIPALIFSWVFELTPGGLKRDALVKPEESIAPQTARRLDRAIIVVLAMALIYFAVDKFALAPHGASPAAHPDIAAANAPSGRADAGKSIAVLPLVNVSGNADDSYLGDGISEEVLTALSKLPGLKVVGRASSFQFRDRDVDAMKVGRALNARSLLTGTVQRAEDMLRITVELVDTETGVQMWSQKYDRPFKNLFALEDDISGAVTKALAVTLGAVAGQPLVGVGTTNPHAHDLYLRARQLAYRSDEASLNQAVVLFNQALADDPSFAAAWAGLAYTYAFLADGYRAPVDLLPALLAAAQQAVQLDPNLAEGHMCLGYAHYAYQRDFPAGLVELEQALALNPGSADAHFFLGDYWLSAKDPVRGGRELGLAAKIDPLNPWYPYTQIWAAAAQDDYALALKAAQRVLEIDAEFSYLTDPVVYAHGAFGHWRECIERAESMPAVPGKQADYFAAVCYAHAGDTARARAILDQLEAAARTRYVDHSSIAAVRAALGDRDGAIAALEQAYQDRSQPLLNTWFTHEFRSMHEDPRFVALTDKLYASAKPATKP